MTPAPPSAGSPARPALIVIHGWGGTFADAVREVRDLFLFQSFWRDGAFIVDRRTGGLLRQVLRAPEGNRWAAALQKLAVARLLSGPAAPPGERARAASSDEYSFDEAHLADELPWLGIPWFPAARERRAAGLRAEAELELRPVMPLVRELDALLGGDLGALTPETEARGIIEERARALGPDSGAFVQMLETLRDAHESGGDADTLASAAFYTWALAGRAKASGRQARIGRDYSYAFVNYHEGLGRLAAGGPADVYLADLPVGAIPDLEGDARRLAQQGMFISRFEDHHPWTPAQRELLDRLVAEGLVGCAALSGPPAGEELRGPEARCGADMVYDGLIAGRPWDCDGARRLRRIAHTEDFAADRTDEGRLLTRLVRGGVCKLEIVQAMVDSIPGDDLPARLRARGWDRLAAGWEAALEEDGPRLSENAFLLRLDRRRQEAGADGGAALGEGSDMPAAARPAAGRGQVGVVLALAPPAGRGRPRLAIGTATEYFAEEVPEADYLFYCYGSRMMVARRINQADLSVNLGVLMRRLGAGGDGGHAGAAVSRPEANERYPRRLLGRVSSANFGGFARYLAFRLEEEGYRVRAVEDRSRRTGPGARQASMRLAACVLIAAAVGLVLVLFRPAFRPSAVRDSNRDFYPHVTAQDADGGQPPEEDGP